MKRSGFERMVGERIRVPLDEPICLWGEKWIKLDRKSFAQGAWKSAVTPWVIDQLKAFQDLTVRDITTVGPSQTSKSTPAIVACCWVIANAPGPVAWVTSKDEKAKEFSKERALPTMKKCEPILPLFPEDRHDTTTWAIRFATCTLDIMGAQSGSNLESTPYRYVFADECRDWPAGTLQKMEKRTRTYPNCKRWRFSTPGATGDEFDQAYQQSTQNEWHFACLGCGVDIWLSPPKAWETLMRWDTNETTKPGGKWRIDEAAKTLRLECPHCAHAHYDLPEVRSHILNAGKYVSLNPNAPHRNQGFRYNGLPVPWIKWRDMLDEFFGACAALKLGNLEPLKIFVAETMAESFDPEKYQIMEAPERTPSSYSYADLEGYTPDLKFFTVDVQDKCFWGVVRGWMKTGESKLLWTGEMLTWGEVKEIQEKHGVKDHLVFIDSGDGPVARSIYARCCQFGWTAFKGTDKPYFLHIGKKTGRRIQRMYSPMTYGDPGMGTVTQGRRNARLFLWSNDQAKDTLARLKSGEGATWEAPNDVPEFYFRQLNSEVRKKVINKATGQEAFRWVRVRRDNHIFDCEAMQIVAASMARLLGHAPAESEDVGDDGA